MRIISHPPKALNMPLLLAYINVLGWLTIRTVTHWLAWAGPAWAGLGSICLGWRGSKKRKGSQKAKK